MIAAAFPPSTSAGVHRTARFARMLPEFGWEPVILTSTEEGCATPAPEWTSNLRIERRAKRRGSSGAKKTGAAVVATEPSLQNADSSRNHRSILGQRPVGTWARNARDLFLETPDKDVWWTVSSTRDAARLVKECNVEAVYTTGPPHSMHLLGRRLKKRLGLPWVADFRDPWARKPWGHKPQNPWGQQLLGSFESFCVRNADTVVLNTPRMADEFRSHYSELSGERFVSIPNGCDPGLAERVQELILARPTAEQNEGTDVRLIHTGSLYRKRDPRPIIDAMQALHQKGLRVSFEQIGPCESGFHLGEHVRERGLSEWVTVEPPVPYDDMLQRMASADIFLLVQPGTDLQVPGKLFEMLLYHTPILALTEPGATADIVDRYGLGAVVQGDDPTAIAQAIADIVARQSTGVDVAAWDDARRDFDGRKLTQELARTFDQITGQQASAFATGNSVAPGQVESLVSARG